MYCRGLVALIQDSDSIVENCHATGDVSANNNAGGLVAQNNGTINYSYSCGAVSVTTSGIGGLTAINNGTVTDCFYDSTESGYDDAGGASSGWVDAGSAIITADMKTVALYTTTGTYITTPWDFVGDPNDDTGTSDYWAIDSSINDGYPYLTELAGSY